MTQKGWKGNYRTWAGMQRFQSSMMRLAGFRMYVVRSSETALGYEDLNTLPSDSKRWDSFNIVALTKGFIDMDAKRSVYGRLKSVGWKMDPSGSYFMPDRSKVFPAYLPAGSFGYSTKDYLFVRGEDVPHLGGRSLLFRIVEIATEGSWTPQRITLGITPVEHDALLRVALAKADAWEGPVL